MHFLILTASLLFSMSCFGEENKNVILITFDGVRWQEFFSNKPDPEILKTSGLPEDQNPLMPYIWEKVIPNGVVLGQKTKPPFDTEMTVSNPVNYSLPAYESIMAGEQTTCYTNDCGYIKTIPLTERLAIELENIAPTEDKVTKKVATIASWYNLIFATTNGGLTHSYIEAGPLQPKLDLFTKNILNEFQQKNGIPGKAHFWEGTRRDRETIASAKQFLVQNKPRFLYISLNDSDSFAHEFNYPKYIESLRMYDRFIEELDVLLLKNGYTNKNTTMIITTDHGRGDTPYTWGHHGHNMPESARIWLAAKGGQIGKPKIRRKELTLQQIRAGISPKSFRQVGHKDIRPTIEALLGLKPISCQSCGKVIPDLL